MRLLPTFTRFLPVVMVLLQGCFVGKFLHKNTSGDEAVAAEEMAKYNPDGEPTLRPGVNVRISVVASGSVVIPETIKEVSAAGAITMPYVGTVPCEGLTLQQLQDNLAKSLQQFYIDPQVTAIFVYQKGMTSPWGTVLILGCVSRPGPVDIPPTCDLSVTKAIQEAGGVSPYGLNDAIRVTRRKADGTALRRTVNLKKIAETGDNRLDFVLKAGDVVFVPESVW